MFIAHEPAPADWPALAVAEHRVSWEEMTKRCSKYAPFGWTPMACSEIRLTTRRCDIWLSADHAAPYIIEHERLHCAGHDHVGDTNLRDMWAHWKSAHG